MKKTLIIAEAGVNHNGDIDMALKLIKAASEANADIVKFQTFKAENLATSEARKANYQIKNTDEHEGQLSMLKKLEFTMKEYILLSNYAKELGIEFLTTAFDQESMDLLRNFSLKRVKIPSGEITNLPYLRSISKLNLPIILSTGMSTLGEVECAIECLEEEGCKRNDLSVLHCTSEYPAPHSEVNLKAIQTLKNAFRLNVGYSDHTIGNEIAIAAVALGASIIEKHITLDRNLPGPDHIASTEPNQFKDLVKAIRNIELSIGDGIKKPTYTELKNISIVRKSLIATKNIKRGEIMSYENIGCKRPGDGISPMRIDEFIGKRSIRDYKVDEKIDI